ncbi:hypothetical protein [Dyella amyloliquefaciens]|uniref:hypothetical protein n=1 Tax=Dyella amyloliquefaciens TaxID=1770545 RepID=UPI00102EB004|nr:hypothetical protein [Dyella amyloliquefaciens]
MNTSPGGDLITPNSVRDFTSVGVVTVAEAMPCQDGWQMRVQVGGKDRTLRMYDASEARTFVTLDALARHAKRLGITRIVADLESMI